MENQGTSNIFNDGPKQSLPNATAVLVLGIISIVGCFCYMLAGLVGIVCGIIALVLASKDSRRYRTEPHLYTIASYNNLKAGRVCAIIGTVLSSLYLLFIIFFIAIIGLGALSHPEQIMRHYQGF